MNINLQFSDAQAIEIEVAASRLGVTAEEFAKGAVLRFIAENAHDFSAAAEYVLTKNEELYKRLS